MIVMYRVCPKVRRRHLSCFQRLRLYSHRQIHNSNSNRIYRNSNRAITITNNDGFYNNVNNGAEPSPTTLSIIGAGAWGTTLAKIAGEKHSNLQITLCGKNPAVSSSINFDRENKVYLPHIKLPKNIFCTTDLTKLFPKPKSIDDMSEDDNDAKQYIFAIPGDSVPGLLNQLDEIVDRIPRHINAICCVKSFLLNDEIMSDEDLSLSDRTPLKPLLFTQVIRNKLKQLQRQRFGDIENIQTYVGVLSGANIAWELASDMYSECLFWGDTPALRNYAEDLLFCKQFQVEILKTCHCHNPSVHQLSSLIEMYGALRYVIALGAGFIDGYYNVPGSVVGNNEKAMLIRRAICEIDHFCEIFFDVRFDDIHWSTLNQIKSHAFADIYSICSAGSSFSGGRFLKNMKMQKSAQDNQDLWFSLRLHGLRTAKKMMTLLEEYHLEKEFPILYGIGSIAVIGDTDFKSLFRVATQV